MRRWPLEKAVVADGAVAIMPLGEAAIVAGPPTPAFAEPCNAAPEKDFAAVDLLTTSFARVTGTCKVEAADGLGDTISLATDTFPDPPAIPALGKADETPADATGCEMAGVTGDNCAAGLNSGDNCVFPGDEACFITTGLILSATRGCDLFEGCRSNALG